MHSVADDAVVINRSGSVDNNAPAQMRMAADGGLGKDLAAFSDRSIGSRKGCAMNDCYWFHTKVLESILDFNSITPLAATNSHSSKQTVCPSPDLQPTIKTSLAMQYWHPFKGTRHYSVINQSNKTIGSS